MKAQGKLTVVCGSMYAGKSEELIRLARRSLYAKKRVQVFKPKIDDRYHQTMVVSHQGVQFEAEVAVNVEEMRLKLDPKVQVLLIEEVQFFDSSVVDFCVEVADSGVEVVCAGLDQDFRRQPFGPMPTLLAVADEVVKLRAICMKCGATASHTYRMVNGKPAHWDDPIVLIGATESYEARCRNCFEIRRSKKR
jgi:thymidine kinase